MQLFDRLTRFCASHVHSHGGRLRIPHIVFVESAKQFDRALYTLHEQLERNCDHHCCNLDCCTYIYFISWLELKRS